MGCITPETPDNDKYTLEVLTKGGSDKYFESLEQEYNNKNKVVFETPSNDTNLNSKFEKLSKEQKCPLLIIESSVTFNSINTPIAQITFYNNSNKSVDAFEVDFDCFNAWDEPVNYYRYGKNAFRGFSQNIQIDEKDTKNLEWNLTGFNQTAKVKNVRIYRLHFTDGSIWKRK